MAEPTHSKQSYLFFLLIDFAVLGLSDYLSFAEEY
jgi:hypothetical protein